MSNRQSMVLLAALLGIFAARGLSSDALDPWRSWIAFKQFAREYQEQPDPGLSVQVAPDGDRRPVRLFLVRQILVPKDDRLEPIGGVACEFEFAPRRWTPRAWAEWSFDHPSFDRFVDAVEQYPLFADLLVTRPIRTGVYWQDA